MRLRHKVIPQASHVAGEALIPPNDKSFCHKVIVKKLTTVTTVKLTFC